MFFHPIGIDLLTAAVPQHFVFCICPCGEVANVHRTGQQIHGQKVVRVVLTADRSVIGLGIDVLYLGIECPAVVFAKCRGSACREAGTFQFGTGNFAIVVHTGERRIDGSLIVLLGERKCFCQIDTGLEIVVHVVERAHVYFLIIPVGVFLSRDFRSPAGTAVFVERLVRTLPE